MASSKNKPTWQEVLLAEPDEDQPLPAKKNPTGRIEIQLLTPDALAPVRATRHSAGFDIVSPHEFDVNPGDAKLVMCGFTIQMPDDRLAFITPRSGLFKKHQISVGNSPGLIDADYYPNEVGVLLENRGRYFFRVKRGDRIAQMIVMQRDMCEIEGIRTLDEEREGGFGSTGMGEGDAAAQN